MPSNLPNFIIIGAMKAATTSLYQQLKMQPGIFMPDLKEPNFFSDDATYSNGLDWYRQLFSKSGDAVILGEASTHYTKLPTYPHTVDRLVKANMSCKMIYVMRDPIDRLVSQYIHEWSQRKITVSIDKAINEFPELIHYSRYYYQLQPYFKAYGHDNVLPVFFERLKANPQQELERVCEFIDLDVKPVWYTELKPSNASSKRIKRFPMYELLIHSRFTEWLRRALVPQKIRDVIKSRLVMSERPVISENVLNQLKSVLDKDLEFLGTELGVPLNCDNFKDVVSQRRLEWQQ